MSLFSERPVEAREEIVDVLRLERQMLVRMGRFRQARTVEERRAQIEQELAALLDGEKP